MVRCACDPDPEGNGGTVVDHVRLFPVREECRWTYRVHEQILPSLRRVGIEVQWSDVMVRHVGYVDRALRNRKLARDFEILLGEHEDNPNEPFVLFNLGTIALEHGDNPRALEFLHKSLMLSRPNDSITKQLYSLLSRVHQRMNDFALAKAAVDKGLTFEPNDAELLFRKGVLHRLTGDDSTAQACWNKVVTLKPTETFSSYDPAIYGELTRKNLEALRREKGSTGEVSG